MEANESGPARVGKDVNPVVFSPGNDNVDTPVVVPGYFPFLNLNHSWELVGILMWFTTEHYKQHIEVITEDFYSPVWTLI